MSSAIEDEKQVDLKALCSKSSVGKWEVNTSKLATVVLDEGFTFVDATGKGFIRRHPSTEAQTVFLLTNSQVLEIGVDTDMISTVAWLLLEEDEETNRFLRLSHQIYHYAVRKWLSGEMENCTVCYELLDKCSLERSPMSCFCGTALCFGCRVDMYSMSDRQIFCCPICRRESDAMENNSTMLTMIVSHFRRGLPLGEISDERSAFVEKMISVDLSLPRECVSKQLDAAIAATLGEGFGKSVASASADDSSAVTAQSKGGCAKCGKQFWDKLEWRRAPKCAKCRRTAYCSAKCRKKHRKTHAGECIAHAPKRKKKTKRKPKKRKCSPY